MTMIEKRDLYVSSTLGYFPFSITYNRKKEILQLIALSYQDSYYVTTYSIVTAIHMGLFIENVNEKSNLAP